LTDPNILPWLAAASWIIYGGIHSALASTRSKNRIAEKYPKLIPHYRITYNVLALLLLLVPLGFMFLDRAEPIIVWHGLFAWFANAVALAAIAGFVWSLKFYDLHEFAGLLNKNQAHAFEVSKLKISPLHRFVRHPWYFFMLVIIWTRDMNATHLVSAAVITLYLIIGSRLEENKLIAQFGDSYRIYREKVSGLIPLPWKILSQHDQRKINQQ
jgi:methanethiol S-methyltransferase